MHTHDSIYLETREDLIKLLNQSNYDYIIIKFKATWCKPCKTIEPFVNQQVSNKFKELNEKQKTNVFLYIEADVDECVDLYSFLKKMKRINGVPSMILYDKSVYSQFEDEYKYIPQHCVTGSYENKIKQLFDMIQ